MLTPADMPPGYVLAGSTPTEVEIRDEFNAELFIAAGVDTDGSLGFKIQAEDPNDSSRSAVRGKVLFALVMRHFGDPVTAVRGYWTGGANLLAFNRGIAAGLSDEQAAADTWTGKRATDFGFTAVSFQQRMKVLGGYGWVRVRFSRPEGDG